MELKEIIGQHGNSVARAFKKLNINAPVTEKNLLLNIILHKEQLVDAIEFEIENEAYNGFGEIDLSWAKGWNPNDPTKGSKLAKTKIIQEVTVKNKKSKAQKVKNTLSDILDVVGQGFGIYAGIKGAQQGQTQQPGQPAPDGKPEAEKKMNRWLIATIVLIVAMVLFLIAGKKK